MGEFTGSAYITGVNEWIPDDDDSLEYGFLLDNKNSDLERENDHGKRKN